MELLFDASQTVVGGDNMDMLHMWDNQANLLYLVNGRLQSSEAPTPLGVWGSLDFSDGQDVAPDDGMSSFRLDSLSGFGAVGAYRTGSTQKLLIYEYRVDVSEYLESANIKHALSSPISSLTLALENPKNPNPDKEGNVAVGERSSLLSPGSKVILKFGAGQIPDEYELGTFYLDRSQYTLGQVTASVDARNLIGKALRDQTLDANAVLPYAPLHENLGTLLQAAQIRPDEYVIETSELSNAFAFTPKDEVLQTIEEMLKVTNNWVIAETVDGRVIIGSPTFGGFPVNSMYLFERNTDVFSRAIVRDDQSVYRKVCVHTSDFTVAAYCDVEVFAGWSLRANKTMYVQVADGTREDNAAAYAEELASRLAGCGKIETFVGPFRPQLLCGDGATIVDEIGQTELGLITEVNHQLGKSGFSTSFTVDSGGRLGRGRLSDYVSMLGKTTNTGAVSYEEGEEPSQGGTPAVDSLSVAAQAQMVGSIVLEAGSNVTLTQDTASKKITIAATGGSSGSGGGISVVTELPSAPTDGQAVLVYTASHKYLAVYYAATAKWYRVTMIDPNTSLENVYWPAALYDLMIGDATKSIAAVTVSVDFTTALRIKGAANMTKQLLWTFTSGAGLFRMYAGCETEGGNYDYAYVYIDDVDISGKLGGSIVSKYIEKVLTAGSHVLKVTYRKDGSGDSGYDGVQIYAIAIP